MLISQNGNPGAKIWLVIERPFPRDIEKGYLFSSGLGYVFNQMWKDAGIPIQPYIYSLKPDTEKTYDDFEVLQEFQNEVDTYQPPLIGTIGKRATALLCPETILKKKGKKNANQEAEASLDKYSSSLLTSPFISHQHYCIPQLSPADIASNWSYRNIAVSIDLGRIKDEYEVFNRKGVLQPLPQRTLTLAPDYYELMQIFYNFQEGYKDGSITYLSNDIETIRPPKGSKTHPHHPGFPYTVALAPSPGYGVSFSLWDYEPVQLVQIWRELVYLLQNIPIIGQNFFSFDAHFYEALGFKINLSSTQDTLIRHHILWPELEHKLQFLTKQYTRQPFYKDEGKHWSPKQKKSLMHYNALDATVTYEVYLGQENDFNDRPYLR